jgi:hypothetical protein
MSSRRQLLTRTLAASFGAAGAPLVSLANVVAPGAGRTALVIGNERYPHNPLGSAANDARAMADLLAQAGFSVELKLNATLAQMTQAIGAFGDAVADPKVDTSLFFYAGHAAQLDWRNYLLPVDGNVASAADVRKRCVDLGLLLGKLKRAKGRTTLIVLDACRDDPFGPRFRPPQKGMSQYDAPPGSLLAFATSPGRVAVEIVGRRHGLYTEHLLRELSVKGVRIEDALKRVRLNVRFASDGMQVPWESTSLESDVYLFPAPRLTEAELERQIKEEFDAWSRIRASTRLQDWVDFLQRFPNGRFSEVAQVRMRSLLASATTAKRPPAKSPPLRLGPGLPVPARFKGSGNPNSAGTYAFRPVWTPGDEYVFHELDRFSGVVQRRFHIVVKRVDEAGNRVEFTNGSLVDLMGSALKEGSSYTWDLPIQVNPAELQVGYRWTSHFRQAGLIAGEGDYEFRIVARENVRVPAGEFSAFRIEGVGSIPGASTKNVRADITRWIVPGLNNAVRRENRQAGLVRVLVSARQAVMG